MGGGAFVKGLTYHHFNMTTPKTILIAEDNEDTLLLLTAQLRKAGYLVLQAQDGFGAIDQLREKRPDLLLLDLMMPGLSGFEVLEEVEADAELRTIPVIVLSAVADSEAISRCVELGAREYMIKPYDPDDLLRRIGSALGYKILENNPV
jgi:DNA-binding response OmpR family regulator